MIALPSEEVKFHAIVLLYGVHIDKMVSEVNSNCHISSYAALEYE